MKIAKHDHCGGVHSVPLAQQHEIEAALVNCTIQPALRAASKIRIAVLASLVKSGWSEEVTITAGSAITISSARNNVGLCLQTGNMSRMYADLLKLQTLFVDGSISAGAMVLPTAQAARLMGSNIVNADRLLKELRIFRKVIHIPLITFAFE